MHLFFTVVGNVFAMKATAFGNVILSISEGSYLKYNKILSPRSFTAFRMTMPLALDFTLFALFLVQILVYNLKYLKGLLNLYLKKCFFIL